MDELQKIVQSVDNKIKKSLARAENPIQGNQRIDTHPTVGGSF